MTDERPTERHATDEPDGTPAYTASLRPAGESLGDATTGDDLAGDDTDEGGGGRAGYDADAVSGDTDAYRPE